ncbi:MAG TPA: hypothetical protein VNS46_06440 [Nocardioides sp.]|nr:hypothetical protein [Nocardioides sp.]
MTHPPGGPSTPPPPGGPRKPAITPLDPDSDAGQQAKEAIERVLAEIQVKVWRRNNSSKQHKTDAA